MFKISVEKHIQCIKVGDLWKIVRSVINLVLIDFSLTVKGANLMKNK